jgi:hypothetical protein
MKKNIQLLLLSALIGTVFFSSSTAQDNQKLAQAGFHFLSITSDAKAAAMAEAVTSLQMGASSLFFNPAGMADMDHFVDITGSTNQWIADIKHYTISAAFSPFHGDYGVLGVSYQYVDYGTFFGTVVDQSANEGFRDTGKFKLYASAIGVGYAAKLTDRFSVGGQVRMAWQDLGQSVIPNAYESIPIYAMSDTAHTGTPIGYEDSSLTVSNKLNPLVFDFGTQFKTGFKSLVFGVSVRNFSGDVQYAYEVFQLPLVFTLGISMNVLDLLSSVPLDQELFVSIDASHYRDQPEQLKIGADYHIMKLLALRAGYKTTTDEEGSGFSFGLGVAQAGFSFDYSYTPMGVFDKVQRMTARFSL